MADSMLGSAAGICVLAVMLFSAALPAGAAALPSADAELDMRAANVEVDLRRDLYELKGNVRVTQGPMLIESETATVEAPRSDNSRWRFERAVHIKTPDADLKSNAASATVVGGQIATARVEGGPAEFEQVGGAPDRQVRGRASVIDYDFGRGVVTLSGEVWFAYGKDEFRTDKVVYNIRDERIQANPAGEASGRVKGTIRARDRLKSDNDPLAPQLDRVAIEAGE